MPTRKPLVIIDGQLQQLPAGDTLDAIANEVDAVPITNASASAIAIGTPVFISAANAIQPAQANASGTTEVLGLIRTASIAAAASGVAQTDGVLTATAAQWDAITGQTGGLTPGSIYFLSAATAGRLTRTAPTAIGSYVARIGRAISSIEFEITLQPPILL